VKRVSRVGENAALKILSLRLAELERGNSVVPATCHGINQLGFADRIDPATGELAQNCRESD
jgi:hypothetical protein